MRHSDKLATPENAVMLLLVGLAVGLRLAGRLDNDIAFGGLIFLGAGIAFTDRIKTISEAARRVLPWGKNGQPPA